MQIAPDRIVAVLSLAAADARIAADVSGGALDAFAADSIELMLDGTRLPGTIEKQAADGEAGSEGHARLRSREWLALDDPFRGSRAPGAWPS